MATTYRGTTQRIYNNTGVVIAANALLAITGFNTDTRTALVAPAIASGGQLRAQLVALAPLGVGRVGYASENAIIEGINTTAWANVGDPVYLDPAVAGGFTAVKPNDAAQDLQRVGKVLTISPTVGRIFFDLRGSVAAGTAPGEIGAALLTEKPYHDIGRGSFGWIRFTGVTADGQRITIGGRVYEFDDNAVLGVGADVAVDVSGGLGDANSALALAAAVNGDTSRAVDALRLGTIVLLASRNANAVNAISVDVSLTPNALRSAANLGGGAIAGAQRRLTASYSISATDVTWLAATLGTSEIIIAVFPSTVQPTLYSAFGWQTGLNQPQLLDGATIRTRQVNNNLWAVTYAEPVGGALFAATDRVTVDIGVAG